MIEGKEDFKKGKKLRKELEIKGSRMKTLKRKQKGK